VNRFAHVCKTGLAAFVLMAAVVACGSDDASRDRNSLGVQGTACVKPGQVTKVSKQSVVCAKTNIGPLWYATMKAKGKAQTCNSPGMIRKKSNIVWACGVVKSKKLWQATQPLPAAVLASTTGIEPGASQSNPALDSTQVQAAADNVVLADPKIPDDKTVTQVQVIEELHRHQPYLRPQSLHQQWPHQQRTSRQQRLCLSPQSLHKQQLTHRPQLAR